MVADSQGDKPRKLSKFEAKDPAPGERDLTNELLDGESTLDTYKPDTSKGSNN